ncbi:hypothetical protein FRB94_008844 [Tulasnella sp. JGI-2019a]|nr:hypothetical protein FRB93_010242 [Tulasnella sp. JGI-2019a]KAG8995716.1 hypothetical protein FRB94_008844 [Tulasnella sp. JGI-2019a]KAG9026756.1 hypothetical protein FRB95_008505 [Tulasnella sp. JGI-2019a]
MFTRSKARNSESHRERVAGGYKAALTNPNTTHDGREHAKHELRRMGESTHVPIMTKIKRTIGIRSTPKRKMVLDSERRTRTRTRKGTRRSIL